MLLLARGRLRRMSTVFIIVYNEGRQLRLHVVLNINSRIAASRCSSSDARSVISV